MEKCQHPEVTKHEGHTPETRWEPAEYDVWFTCTECGARLETSDLDGSEIIHE